MAEAKKRRNSLYPERKTPEECKFQGDFLEKLAAKVLRDKGYIVYPHAVEDRHKVDVKVVDVPTGTLVARDNWTMEVSNLSKGRYYPRKRLKSHLQNIRENKKKKLDSYWLTSHKEALKNVQKDLDDLDVKVIDIGKVVLPENLEETYDLVKEAIESEIPDAARKKEQD